MGDVIDFKKKLDEKHIEVELEQDGQQLLETAIVALWTTIKGHEIQQFMDHEQYIYTFLQFSGVCFDAMEEQLIVVDEDGNLGIAVDLRESMEDAIKDIEREFSTSH